MLLDEKEAEVEAHKAEKDALWRRIEVTISDKYNVSLSDGPQRARLPIPPAAATFPSCLLWSLRIFPSLPGSRLRFFIATQVQHSYSSSTNG